MAAWKTLSGHVRAAAREEDRRFGEGRAYAWSPALAHEAKSVVQMIIGVVTLVGGLLSCITGSGGFGTSREATMVLLGGVGVGLAAAAVGELAYTVVTPGPDEALNPVMLGLAAAILLLIGGLDADELKLE